MEHHEMSKLLYDSSVLLFVTIKWNEANYLYGDNYSVDKNVRFKAPMLRSDYKRGNKYYRH